MSTELGQVITFYSYKGGTGRSMALANIACLLARGFPSTSAQPALASARVLAIDWDLEAPGLHHFFANHVVAGSSPDELDAFPGLIDLFWELNRRLNGTSEGGNLSWEDSHHLLQEVGLDRFILPTKLSNLSLIKAGAFDGDYSERVNTFPWENFFKRSPQLIPALAEHLAKRFRYILIDSRTGITDTSGICSMLLPEKLVVVFTTNAQSFTGLSKLVRKATDYRRESSDSRPLSVFPLPSRIEAVKPDLLETWRLGKTQGNVTGYQRLFESIFREVYDLDECDLTQYFDEVQLQHVPDYAFGEQIAVEVEKSDSRLSLKRSYENFARRLAVLAAPWEDPQAVALGHDAEEIQRQAEAALEKEDLDQAKELLLQAAELYGRGSILPGQELSGAFHRLGLRLAEMQRFREAESCLRKALELGEQSLGGTHLSLAEYREAFGEVLGQQGKYQEAIDSMRSALEMRLQALGEDHPSVAEDFHRLGALLAQGGHVDESENLFRRSIGIYEKISGESSPEVARGLNDLARILVQQGRNEEAAKTLHHALAILERLPGADTSAATATTLHNLGSVAVGLKDLDQAESLLRRSLELSRESLEGADVADKLGDLWLTRQGFDQAQAFYERAQLIREKLLGPSHPDTITSLVKHGNLARAQGNLERADVQYQRALSFAEKVLGRGSPQRADLLRRQASLYFEMGRLSDAESALRVALEIYESLGMTAAVGISRAEVGEVAIAQGHFEEAIAHLKSCIRLLQEVGHHDVELRALWLLAHAYESSGRAKETYQTYLHLLQKTTSNRDQFFQALIRLGWLNHTASKGLPFDTAMEGEADVRAALLACLTDPQPAIRRVAVQLFSSSVPDEEIRAALKQRLEDPDEEVRKEARKALEPEPEEG